MARTINWDIDDVQEGQVDEVMASSRHLSVYQPLVLRMIKTHLPQTIKMRMKPNTEAATLQCASNLIQWFLRWYGPHYVHIKPLCDEKGIWWAVAHRGTEWYHPNERRQRMEAYAARLGRRISKNGAIQYQKRSRNTK